MAFARATVIGFVAVAVLLILVGCVVPPAGETAPTATPTAGETPTPSQAATSTVISTVTFSPTPTLPGGVTVVKGPTLKEVEPWSSVELVTSLSELPEGEYVIMLKLICPPETTFSCPYPGTFPEEIWAYNTDSLESHLIARVPEDGSAMRVADDRLFVIRRDKEPEELTIVYLWDDIRVGYQARAGNSFHMYDFPSGNVITLWQSTSIGKSHQTTIFSVDDQSILAITNNAGFTSIASDESWALLEFCVNGVCNPWNNLILMLESGEILREPIPYEPYSEPPQGRPHPPVGLLGEYGANISPDGAWLAEYGYEDEAYEVYLTPVTCLFQHPIGIIGACRPERVTVASFPGPSYRCGAYFISWVPDGKSLLFEVTTYHEGFHCPSQGFYHVGIDGSVTRLMPVPVSLPWHPAYGLEGWLPLDEKMLWFGFSTTRWGLYWLDYGGQTVDWGEAPGIPIGAVVVP